jgi:colanic acid biosynthesis glycosyl transferase WcaI
VRVLFHYMYPDNVVSARHFDGLCEGLSDRGWDVEAMPANRGCRDESVTYPRHDRRHGVDIDRVWRPSFRNTAGAGRLLDAAWMLGAWSVRGGSVPGASAARGQPDVVVVGTEPILSVAVAPVLKRLHPALRVAHWVFDLYPEAAIADGTLAPGAMPARAATAVARAGYRSCDLIADIGSCMRRRMSVYDHTARQVTLVPWALSEPSQPIEPPESVRRELFGDAALGLLYSGNFGRAHSYEDILALARRLRSEPIHFCFAVRGNCTDKLRQAVDPTDTNVSFAGFSAESDLENRLASADVHVASLRHEWSGMVVPSKFFGSLAAGRPVVFSGPDDSSVAEIIEQHGVGWVLSPSRVDTVATALRALARDRAALRHMVDRWDVELRRLVGAAGAS